MRLFLFFCFIIFLSGCTSIEVAKEVTKATASIKTSVENIIELEAEKPIEKEKLKKLENETELYHLLPMCILLYTKPSRVEQIMKRF